MLQGAWLLVWIALLLGDGFSPRPEIRVDQGRVSIEAENVPLSQLLDRLSQASGMKVTYEGERPSTPVTMSATDVSEVAAVLQLMEGSGSNYFIRTDASGSGVDVLIISGQGGASRVASSSAQASRHAEPAPDEREVYVEPVDP